MYFLIIDFNDEASRSNAILDAGRSNSFTTTFSSCLFFTAVSFYILLFLPATLFLSFSLLS